MAAFEIETGIPKPEPERRRGRPSTYPWEDMQVGDSILADGESTPKCDAYNAAWQWGYRHGAKFTGRAQGNGKVRIWRVE